MKYLWMFSIVLISSCDVLQDVQSTIDNEPTASEIAMGLKEALTIGISKGSDQLSQLDGYYKSAYKIL
ncbi:MAG: DUF4197 domain-containing protein, partial [Saprospiraceae bacterium]|nr:DUF4197 domain-containing protein [Saprospiraceae bacterium]